MKEQTAGRGKHSVRSLALAVGVVLAAVSCSTDDDASPVPTVLASLYGSFADWSSAARASADAAVGEGWLLPEDAASMLDEANARAVALGLT